MIDNNNVSNSMYSDNNIASDNFSNNTLISFEKVFSGLENLVALFFPSVRNAQVERYRAETTLFIAQKAQELKNKYNIETNPIPPKAAIPLFDRLSTEHEEDMYDLWAKLLLDTSSKYKPIKIQYAEILAKIGGQEAKLLDAIFKYQKGNKYLAKDIEEEMKKYDEKCLIADAADEISGNLEIGDVVEYDGQYEMVKSNSTPEIHINVPYPDDVVIYDKLYLFDHKICDETSLDLLKQLNLIQIFYDSGDICLALSELGYDLLEMLNKYE